MIAPRQSIFREKALKHYTQGKKKDILPNFSSIPATIFVWALLVSLVATGLVAWCVQVPVYLAGSGIVLGRVNQAPAGDNATNVLAFFSSNELTKLRVGQSVKVLLDTNSSQQTGTIVQVLPEATTPTAALEHYGLSFGSANPQSLSMAVALIALNAGSSATISTGSSVVTEVSVGTESMFSAISGLGN